MKKYDINKLADQFIRYLKKIGKSQHTLVSYESDIKQFVAYAEEKGFASKLHKFDKEEFLDYIEYMKEKGFAASTIRRKSFSLNEFLIRLLEKEIINKAPFLRTKDLTDVLPVIVKKPIVVMENDSLKGLVEVVKGDILKESIFRLFSSTACRVSEIANAKWSDLRNNGSDYILDVYGKGKGGMTKHREVIVSPQTMKTLEEMRSQRDWKTEYIIESSRTKKKLTERRINQIIEEAAKKAGIEDISSHTFRKSTATALLEKGLDVAYVSKYLGHSSIEITARNYLNTEKKVTSKVSNLLDEI